jgi:hypothetical protein
MIATLAFTEIHRNARPREILHQTGGGRYMPAIPSAEGLAGMYRPLEVFYGSLTRHCLFELGSLACLQAAREPPIDLDNAWLRPTGGSLSTASGTAGRH